MDELYDERRLILQLEDISAALSRGAMTIYAGWEIWKDADGKVTMKAPLIYPNFVGRKLDAS